VPRPVGPRGRGGRVDGAAQDLRVLERVDVDGQAIRGSDQAVVPRTRRQLNAEVLSASMDRSSLPPNTSTGRICRIGYLAANSRAKARVSALAADSFTISCPLCTA